MIKHLKLSVWVVKYCVRLRYSGSGRMISRVSFFFFLSLFVLKIIASTIYTILNLHSVVLKIIASTIYTILNLHSVVLKIIASTIYTILNLHSVVLKIIASTIYTILNLHSVVLKIIASTIYTILNLHSVVLHRSPRHCLWYCCDFMTDKIFSFISYHWSTFEDLNLQVRSGKVITRE